MLRILMKLFFLSLLMINPFVLKAENTNTFIATTNDLEIEVHIIGFGVDASTEKQLREMSVAAGGQYHSSSDTDDLTAILGTAAGIDVSATTKANKAQTNIQEIEPNNRVETATRVSPVGVITGKFGKRDNDYYIFKINKPGEWTVDISQISEDFQVNLGVYPVGKPWLTNFSQETGKQLIVDLQFAGQYVLKVNEKNNKSSASGYMLNTTFIPISDVISEPNNKPETAYPVIAGAPIIGSILPKGDIDYYKFNAPKSGEWTVSIDKQPTTHQIELGVYPADGGSWYADQSDKGDNKLVVDIPKGGFYILKVNEANRKRSVSGYNLKSTFIPNPDNYEPNNKATIASIIPGTGEIIATILPKNEYDYYIFDTDKAGEWSITVAKQPDTWQIGLGVYPANGGSWLSDRSEKGDNKLVVDLPSPGRYLLRTQENNRKRSISPYKLNTVFIPSEDLYEPNNEAVIAKTISLNSTITATILPKDDHDYYAVDVNTSGRWTINVTEQPQNMHIGLGVYPATGGSWLSDISEKGDNKLVVDLPSAGKYILRATEVNRKRSVLPYKLQMQFQ